MTQQQCSLALDEVKMESQEQNLHLEPQLSLLVNKAYKRHHSFRDVNAAQEAVKVSGKIIISF